MSAEQPLNVDYVHWTTLLPSPPISSSFQYGWSNIQLAHYCLPSFDFPEVANAQHVVIIPLGKRAFDLEIVAEGRRQSISYEEKDFASGCIEIYPVGLPYELRANSTAQSIEWIQFYLEADFLAQVAYESINPNHVELLQTPKRADGLIQQIGLALRSVLEAGGANSCFYADSMATALAAHLLFRYSSRTHHFRNYEDGLSKHKLEQAIDYMQAHLGKNLSLNEIANELGMSQYYFCRLFKQSTGISPHQYLIAQRVEQAKQLLKHPEKTITFIALECGFSNQSHFAKCFRQQTGVSPKYFRNL